MTEVPRFVAGPVAKSDDKAKDMTRNAERLFSERAPECRLDPKATPNLSELIAVMARECGQDPLLVLMSLIPGMHLACANGLASHPPRAGCEGDVHHQLGSSTGLGDAQARCSRPDVSF